LIGPGVNDVFNVSLVDPGAAQLLLQEAPQLA
jgi:hypothetical protein